MQERQFNIVSFADVFQYHTIKNTSAHLNLKLVQANWALTKALIKFIDCAIRKGNGNEKCM